MTGTRKKGEKSHENGSEDLKEGNKNKLQTTKKEITLEVRSGFGSKMPEGVMSTLPHSNAFISSNSVFILIF